MDGEYLLRKLTDFARGHRVLDRDAQKQAHRLAEGLSQYLAARCNGMVESSGERALFSGMPTTAPPF